jgi:hypothetical protein
MLKGRRRRSVIVLVAVGVACSIAFSSVALGAGGLAPQLRWPNGKSVPAGHVKVRVYVPDEGVVIRHNIFLVITPRRKVKDGLLQVGNHCADTCTIVLMKRVPHSAHMYTYADSFNFPGLWQNTPGKYYWQAYYYPNTGVLGVIPSRVGSFRIVG